MTENDWTDRQAPSLDDFEAMGKAALDALPAQFRELVADVGCVVADFPDDRVIKEMGLDSPFDLLGLFHGIGLPQGGSLGYTGQMPNRIWLYRRPILDYWADHDDTLGAIVTHVLVHEIGHHFGFSDDDMEAIEAGTDVDRPAGSGP